MLLLTNLKGHKPNVHYSGFPNHPKTKSSLNISICQSKLKHKCLPLDTLYLHLDSICLDQLGGSLGLFVGFSIMFVDFVLKKFKCT